MRTHLVTMSVGAPGQVEWWIDSKGPPRILVGDDGTVLWCEADHSTLYQPATKLKLVLSADRCTGTLVPVEV